jgi:hypothetical protein
VPRQLLGAVTACRGRQSDQLLHLAVGWRRLVGIVAGVAHMRQGSQRRRSFLAGGLGACSDAPRAPSFQ